MKQYWHKLVLKPFYDLIRPVYQPPENRLSKFRFIGEFSVTTADGLSFRLFNNRYHLETGIYWMGWDQSAWEKTSRELWTQLCRDAATILDVGANTGVFSVVAAAANPQARVIAFEPQPNIFEVLQRNRQINRSAIECMNIAVSNEAGILPFYNYGKHTFSSSNTTAGSLNKDWRSENQFSIEVTVRRLDEVLEAESVAAVDLMKIDVETLEFEVLQGLGERLASDRPVIILEIQNQLIGDKVASLLSGLDYSLLRIHEASGLAAVNSLEGGGDDRNYLLCPQAWLSRIQPYLL